MSREIEPHIRSATQEDIDILSRLGAKTFFETFAADNTAEDMELYIASTFNPVAILAELNNRLTTFLIAFVGEVAVGYAKFTRDKAPENAEFDAPAEIERLYVLKDAQGKYVGAALMQRCLEMAASEGYKTIWLGVWEHNHRAISFYRHIGFVEFGSQKFLLGRDLQDDLLMKKQLHEKPAY